jgi:hypothetical protein
LRNWLLVLAVSTTNWSPEQTPVSGVSGTYELLVCRTKCDEAGKADLLVRGVLVLFESDLGQEALPRGVQARLKDWSTFILHDQKPNACFALQSLKQKGTYIGIIPAGLTRWTHEGHALRVPLYRSPDSGAEVLLTLDRGILTGRSHEYGLLGDEGIVAFVEARWRGPPTPTPCIEAGAT